MNLRAPDFPPDPLPWGVLAGPMAAAEDALARLDERLAHSPIRDGWIARTHLMDAAAGLWLEGALVHLEDLVLHDAGMDVRAPTHEVTRARLMLGVRRRIAAAAPDWAISPGGVAWLAGGGGEGGPPRDAAEDDPGDAPRARPAPADGEGEHADGLAALFADVDAVIASAERALRGSPGEGVRQGGSRGRGEVPLDGAAGLAAWTSLLDRLGALPPTLAAALACEAWESQARPRPWLGALLAAALLRARGKARAHLPCLNLGLKATPQGRRRAADPTTRLVARLNAIAAGAEIGLKDHDRWLAARALLARKLQGRRSTSSLPALLDCVLARPMVSTGMIARELAITPRAAQSLVAELGLREVTGRGRYRAWAVL